MRRIALLAAALTIGLLGLGCRHIAGKCDCTHDPANGPMPAGGNPYPVVGPTMGGPGMGGVPVPGTATPVETAPKPMNMGR